MAAFLTCTFTHFYLAMIPKGFRLFDYQLACSKLCSYSFSKKQNSYMHYILSNILVILTPFKGATSPVLALLFDNCPSDNIHFLNLLHNILLKEHLLLNTIFLMAFVTYLLSLSCFFYGLILVIISDALCKT